MGLTKPRKGYSRKYYLAIARLAQELQCNELAAQRLCGDIDLADSWASLCYTREHLRRKPDLYDVLTELRNKVREEFGHTFKYVMSYSQCCNAVSWAKWQTTEELQAYINDGRPTP